MKKTIKSALSCLAFTAGLVLLLACLSHVMEYKESREKIVPFRRHAKQIDVLFFGDSHTSSDIYPMELWEDYGIASYNLASYNIPIPVSYWVMRNALSSCKPKMVVLDVIQVWEQAKLCPSSSDLHIALDGFPLSRTKLEAIFDLTDDPLLTDKHGHRYHDLRAEFIFPFIKYHSRWHDLNMEDLKPDYNRELGGERNIAVALPDAYEITSAVASEQGFGFAYLRRMIEYCRDAGIHIMLTNLPYPCRNNEDEMMYTNAVTYTAEEYGIEYLDFVYMDQIADYSTDCYDPASHLNPSGAWKVTDFIGQHLSEHYGMPDHRKDHAYSSWNDDYAAYKERKLKSFERETNPYSFLMLLADPSFSPVILIPDGSAVYKDDLAIQLLQNAGRRHLMMEDVDEAVWSDSLMPLELPEGGTYMAVIDRKSRNIGECVENGIVQTSFGSVALNGSSGDAAVNAEHGNFHLAVQPDTDVYVAVLDKKTGEVLYERAVKL